MPENLVLLGLFFGVCYAVLLCSVYFGWTQSLRKHSSNALKEILPASNVVCMHNEEKNLPGLLRDLEFFLQLHPQNEAIFVLDGCTDGSLRMLKEWKQKSGNGKIQLIAFDVKRGKKHALMEGVRFSENEWVYLRDADTFNMPRRSLEIPSFNTKTLLVQGLVRVKPDQKGLTYFQYLEDVVLNVFTVAGIQFKMPIMASAANMMVRKNVFPDKKPYDGNYEIASGDDMFLLDVLLDEKEYLLADPEHVVFTQPKAKVSDLLKQRLRWGGKAFYLQNPYTRFIAFFLFLVNFGTIFFPLWMGIKGIYFYILKCICDILFLFLALKSLNEKPRITVMVISSLIYPVYFSVLGTMAFLKYVVRKTS